MSESDNTESNNNITNDDKKESESPTITTTTSTPVRLFGQFKQNGTGFGSFTSANNTSPSSTSYFTSTLTKFSSTNGTGGGGGGFGSASTSLAASLAPLTSNKPLFGASSSVTKKDEQQDQEKEKDEKDEDDDEDDDDNDDDESNNESTPSLFEKAAEYEAKRASTHPTANIQGDTSTGEEHEVTKFQMAGKLFMYNPDQQQFVERGYGILKINESHDPSDWNKLQARIIMRLDKAFRVILNSPIFPKMTVERATERSVRFGAQDESHLRVFIIKASATDCTNLCKELQSRIEIIERQHTDSPVKTNNLNTSDSTSSAQVRIRKRSHSRSDSDTSETTNDISKKSKLNENYSNDNNNDDTSDDDSVESTKTGEEATAD